MMYPPIFTICNADPAVQAVLGGAPVRLYPFGEAEDEVEKPYATWQGIGGAPENYLDQPPDIDSFALQVDVYGRTAEDARAAAKAIRDAIEPHAQITRWNGEDKDTATGLYHYSFDVDWWVNR